MALLNVDLQADLHNADNKDPPQSSQLITSVQLDPQQMGTFRTSREQLISQLTRELIS